MKPSSEAPYYAVIFTSLRNSVLAGYDEMSERMDKLSRTQPGFLGMHSVKDSAGRGITVSYWKTIEDVRNWKTNSEHRGAQTQGKSDWYKGYEVRICKVEREYKFGNLES